MKIKLDNLSELKNFSSFFSSSDPLTSNSDPLAESGPLVDVDPLVKDNKYKIVIKNRKSVNISQHEFTNNLKNNHPHTETNRKILSLLKLHGQFVEITDLPIKIDNEIKFYRRHIHIFNQLNLNPEKPVEKWSFISVLNQDLNYKLPNDLCRVLIQVENQDINVILFDPHHLFATKNHSKQYRKVKNFNGCISQLFHHFE